MAGWLSQESQPQLVSTLAPFLLGVSYVSSLYVWRSQYDRDHPETIKRRFISAGFMTAVSPVFVYMFGAPWLLQEHSLASVLGLRLPGLLHALTLPLLLTALLFTGSIAMLLMDDKSRLFLSPVYWNHYLRDWIWWRNHVVAPFSEEFTFRACMLPVLLGYYTHKQAIVISPLFFGVAHFHHMVERIRKGQDILSTFLISLFQFTYTTIFGMYSAFLFIRTGHLAAPFIVHAYCNFMGFPDIAEVVNSEPRKRLFLILMFVFGATAFYLLLDTLVAEELFSNIVYRVPSME